MVGFKDNESDFSFLPKLAKTFMPQFLLTNFEKLIFENKYNEIVYNHGQPRLLQTFHH